MTSSVERDVGRDRDDDHDEGTPREHESSNRLMKVISPLLDDA
jgi:hypothetical protein